MFSSLRVVLRYVLALFMIGIGVLHFTAESFFTQIVPPFLPAPRLLVWLSGVAEIALGIGLIPARFRRWAGYGLVALFVAVFPANIYMAVTNLQIQGMPSDFEQPSQLMLWLRLPLQVVLITWALWVSRPSRRHQLQPNI
jgi:uncharacterized membrane protein